MKAFLLFLLAPGFAYTAAMEVINNQTKYGAALLADYADVHREGNDYNSEILFSVERIPGDLNDNEAISGSIRRW